MRRAWVVLVVAALWSCAGEGNIRVSIDPATETLQVGETRTLHAFDGDHKEIAAVRVTWASNNEAVATVTAAGAVTGVASGEVNIVAIHGSARGTARISVQPEPLPPALTLAVTGPGTVTSVPAGIECTSAGGAACTAKFVAGTSVTLTATATTDAFFTSWGGDCTGTSGSCVLELSGDKTATATFTAGATLTVAEVGPGSVTSSVGGISCGSTCMARLPVGTQVTLTATPSTNAVFDSWTGCSSLTNTCVVTLTADTQVTAQFIATHELTVTVTGPGTVHSSGTDINCSSANSPCTQTLPDGTAVTLTATEGANGLFDTWTGCTSSNNVCSFTLNAATQITAQFIATHDLTVTVTGPGTVHSSGTDINCSSANSPCTQTLTDGTAVTLTSTADANGVFDTWTGCTSSDNVCSFTLNAATPITASFLASHILTVSITGPGTVHSSGIDINCSSSNSPCTQTRVDGTPVTLTATPDTKAVFDGWTGCTSSDDTCSFTVSAPTLVGAAFTAAYDLTVTVVGSGTVHSTATGYPDIACTAGPCVQTLRVGTSVSLTATPSGGSSFSAFSQDCTGATCAHTMLADHAVTATFSSTPPTTVVHTTGADFQSGTWANLGSLVTGSGGGAVQLATGGAELLAGSKTTLLGRQINSAVAVCNGRVYVAGGYGPLPASLPVTTVRSAAVNADGTVSAWRVESPMPEAMRDQEMVAWNGRLYVAGGYNTSGASRNVYSTKVNGDGTLAPWDTETQLPTSRNGVPLVVWGNRIYAVSGSLNASNFDGVVTSAPLDGTGRVGAWRSETTVPGGTAWHAIAYNGRIYSLGGASNADDTALIYSVAIGADGVLGTWRAETPYPVSRNNAGIAVWGGRIYAAGGRIGGVTGPATGTIISSAIAADGTLSAWRTESVAVPNGVGFFQAAAWDGTLVMIAADDVGSVWTFPINSAGTLGSSWTQTLLPSERHGHDTFAFGGTLFAAGGLTGATGTANSSVIGAPLAADGSVGVWATSANPWFTSGGHRAPAAIINSRIYAFKSSGGPGTQAFGYNTVSSAGVGATWTGSAWPYGGTWIDANDVVALGTHLYVIGGENYSCGVIAGVFHAAVATDGSVGSWTTTTSLPAGRYQGGAATWNGFVYHVAGRYTGCPSPTVPLSDVVYYAKAATDGSLGAWATATALPAAIQDVAGVEAWDGVLYVIGGTDGNQATARTTVYTAKINADGSLQTWSTGTALPAGRTKAYGNNFVTKWHGKLHVVGGFDYASPQGGRNTVWTSGVESYAPRGSYVNVMDFGADRTLQSLAWTASSSGVVTTYISTASSTGTFSDWAAVTSGATLSLANVRYVRYRFDFAPDVGGLAPTVFDVTASLAP